MPIVAYLRRSKCSLAEVLLKILLTVKMTSGFAIFVSVFFLADRSDRVDGTENKLKGTSNHLPVGQPHKMHDVFFFRAK